MICPSQNNTTITPERCGQWRACGICRDEECIHAVNPEDVRCRVCGGKVCICEDDGMCAKNLFNKAQVPNHDRPSGFERYSHGYINYYVE